MPGAHNVTVADVAGLILAAGAGTRYGGPKADVVLGGATLLERAVATADAALLSPILAVVATGREVPPPARAVRNDDPSAGLSRSLKLGLGALPQSSAAAVVMLADQPTVRAPLLCSLLAARGRRPVVATQADGVVGPPALIERRAFALVDELSGDTGLRDVLRRRAADMVATITTTVALADVDTPDDLAALGEPCVGCGALLQPSHGPTHDYIGASPACWAAYGELLAREFGDPAYGWLHRQTADAYAAQHPGVDGRRQRQSVALHLIALCHWLEHRLGGSAINVITRQLAASNEAWPWLKPPRAYGMTVVDVLAATSRDEHTTLSRMWAASVWGAWSPHHELVRRWAADSLRADG